MAERNRTPKRPMKNAPKRMRIGPKVPKKVAKERIKELQRDVKR